MPTPSAVRWATPLSAKENRTLADKITSADWADSIRARITDRAHKTDYYGGSFSRSDHGTAHIAVPRPGRKTPCPPPQPSTSTLAPVEPAARPESSGNDEMDDFSTPGTVNAFGFQPSPSNFIVPGKRPMSSMSPLIIFNSTTGEVQMVVGAAGGSRIISSSSYAALRTLLFKETVKEAIDAPRIHHQLYPEFVSYDEGFPEPLLKALRSKGHEMKQPKAPVNNVVIGVCATRRTYPGPTPTSALEPPLELLASEPSLLRQPYPLSSPSFS